MNRMTSSGDCGTVRRLALNAHAQIGPLRGRLSVLQTIWKDVDLLGSWRHKFVKRDEQNQYLTPKSANLPLNYAALGLSATAAYVSVMYGMAVLFSWGAPVVLVLGGFIELAKFLGFGVVSAGWRTYSFVSKWLMVGLLLLAAVVNAAAVYGWLIASHVGPIASRTATYTQQDAGAGANVEVAQGRLQDTDRRIQTLDKVRKLTTTQKRERDGRWLTARRAASNLPTRVPAVPLAQPATKRTKRRTCLSSMQRSCSATSA
jgi:hypothetical protein